MACQFIVLLLAAACTSSGAEPVLAMYPIDGSVAAAPTTAISFRGPPEADLGDLVVTGSASGTIEGRVVTHADGAGLSFHHDHRLEPGEDITIDTGAAVAGDGDLGFRVAVPAQPPEELPSRGEVELPAPVLRDLVTMPDAAVPAVTVTGDVGQGVHLSTHAAHAGSDMGAQITDATGELVWWRPSPAEGVTLGALEQHELDGQPVLAWFEGTAPFGVGNYQGEWIVVDAAYQEVARLPGGNGIATDLHDLVITPTGTALIMAYHPIVMDLSEHGGDDTAIVMDNVVQEVDIASGDVLLEWHSVDHIPLTDTMESDLAEDEIVDYAHINAADVDADGRVVLSLRHTSQIVEIDRVTGERIWSLGGTSPTADVGEDRGVSYPHHVRWVDEDTISVFDNGVGMDPLTSRGVVYELSPDRQAAEVVAEYHAEPVTYTVRQGSLQLGLSDGGALAMWSVPGTATRFDATGEPSGSVDLGTTSYRIFESDDWVGQPAEPPVVVATGPGELVVSWNGATLVDRWEVLAGSTAVAVAPAESFETRLSLPDDVGTQAGSVTVRALGADGTELEGSAVTTLVR